MFEQTLDPTGHVWLSVLVSLVPLIALLFMLAALRMTAWLASILVGAITIPIGVLVWHAPLSNTLKSYFYGGLQGFWVIDWITFWGLIIFNTLVVTGNFERFKNWMIHHARQIFEFRLSCWPGLLARCSKDWSVSVFRGRWWCRFSSDLGLPTLTRFALPL